MDHLPSSGSCGSRQISTERRSGSAVGRQLNDSSVGVRDILRIRAQCHDVAGCVADDDLEKREELAWYWAASGQRTSGQREVIGWIVEARTKHLRDEQDDYRLTFNQPLFHRAVFAGKRNMNAATLSTKLTATRRVSFPG